MSPLRRVSHSRLPVSASTANKRRSAVPPKTTPPAVASADAVPTRNSYAVLDVLTERITEQTDALERIIDEDIPAFIEQLHEFGVPSITPGP